MVLAILGATLGVSRDDRIAEIHLERALTIHPNSAWA
jgi:hypothetical protein